MLTSNSGNCDDGAGGTSGARSNCVESVIPTKNINYHHHRPSFVERIKDNVRNSNYNLSNFANYANLNIITNINSNFNNNNQHQQNNANKESSAVPKMSTSSNSSLSSTGEQQQQQQYPRSIFYTDPDNMELKSNENLVDGISTSATDTTIDLRRKLQYTEENLEMQMRKCENLISFYSNQIQYLTNQLETERLWRKTHLTKVVKALLSFEAKLKNDQRIIRHQLYEKDGQLNRLYQEIVNLRERYGDKSPLELLDQCEVAQFCPSCRKEYHLLESEKVPNQVYSNLKTTIHSPLKMKGITTATATSTSESLEYLSSSEDGITSFVEARRSKKYMSKRTSGTFRDYLRLRSNGTEIESPPSTTTTSSPTTVEETTALLLSDLPQQQDLSLKHKPLPHDNKECGTIIFDKDFINKNNCKSKKNNVNDKENDIAGLCSSIIKSDNKNEQSPLSAVTGSAESAKTNDEYNVNGYSVINGSNRDNNVVLRKTLNSSFMKNYKSENSSCDRIEKKKISTVIQFESTDDWYASASDMEDSDTAISKPYGYNAVNPVLECVNQILLQQSMDGIIELSPSPETMESIRTSEAATAVAKKEPLLSSQNAILCTGRNQKRVHFSTQNSMVQVPRTTEIGHHHQHHHQLDSFDLTNDQLESGIKEKSNHHQQQPPPPPPPLQLMPTVNHNKSFSYESVYSNEYEPIGSENTCTTNHYVDMESKMSQEDRQRQREKSKTPPALPPKPANLMKIRQALKIAGKSVLPSKPMIHPSIEQQNPIDNESEPDYCSIPELIASMPRNVQIIVEVHNNPNDISDKIDCNEIKHFIRDDTVNNDDTNINTDDDGAKTDITDESFADVPKLPNVAAILSPKKDYLVGQFIVAQDNYITKSSSTEAIPVTLTVEPSLTLSAATVTTTATNKSLITTMNTPKKTSNILVEIKKKNLAMNNASSSLARGPKMSIIAQMKKSNFPDKLPALADNDNAVAAGNNECGNDDDDDDDEDKLHIQSEFDWYNLDAEYGNIHRPEIKRQKANSMIKNIDEDEGCCNDGSCDSCGDGIDSQSGDSSPSSSISPTTTFDEKQNEITNSGIEYKLDEEFSLKMDSENDVELNTNNEHHIGALINYNKSSSRVAGLWKQNAESTTTLKFDQTTGIESPQRKTYETFLQETGLTAKPLPRKRRIFYSAPFV